MLPSNGQQKLSKKRMILLKKIILSLLILAVFFFICCHQPDLLTGKAELMADLECKAITLREQRFTLANQIRFTQDTLLKPVSTQDSSRLEQKLFYLNSQKELLTNHSLLLADTIHNQLDSLRKFFFKKESDRTNFDQKLNELIAKRGCKR